MTSASVELRVGAQSPRVSSVPPHVSSAGDEAIELAARAGLNLDPWEQLVLREALGERADGKWAADEVGLVVPRQNGKGSVLEARELAGLFLFGENLIVHSAHEQRTSSEHFRRLVALIEEAEFSNRIQGRPKRGKGAEEIELKSGQRIKFVTRTSGGGRGLTGDLIVLDEAMILRDDTIDALIPTQAATSIHGNPQTWYAGSAVDREKHEHGQVLSRVRHRGLQGDDRLAYFEWSAEGDNPDLLDPLDAESPDTWAQANPGLGIRISEEYIAGERRRLSARGFAVERLGVGDWYDDETDETDGITADMLAQARDPQSAPNGPVFLAFDVRPDRSAASISAAGRRADGLWHVELVDRKTGTGWVAARLKELVAKHAPLSPPVMDLKSPAAALLVKLKEAGVQVKTVGAQQIAESAGLLYDALEQGTVKYRGEPEITAAALGAAKRPLGDAWAWSRKHSQIDISPLVSASLALHAAMDALDTPFTFEVLG